MRDQTFEQAMAQAAADTRTLGAAFLSRVRRGPRAVAVQDFRGTIGRLRLAAAALAMRPLLGLEPDEVRVGVMLPAGQAGALVNVALALAGRTSVNLNHTAGEVQVARMCDLAGVRTIISSRLYLSRIGDPELPCRVVLAEDLVPQVGRLSVVVQMLRVMLLPARLVDGAQPDDVATVVFSSGSTGDPKGVQLTHRQILANCDSYFGALDIDPADDVLLSPLPLFHTFGLVPGMWLPLAYGFPVASQADPTDAAALGKLAAASGATFVISTPTFVRAYMRRVTPEQFGRLKFAVVGAERCPLELHEAFRTKYGADLLEGYGTTELAPAAAINRQGASRPGTVGPPMPGVEVFTMHPDSKVVLPTGETGLLVVRSPARMLGYLHRDDLTREVFVHGGYDTGDIGCVDEDGYVHITGRLARFAKVAGEMVPLDNVERALQDYLGAHYDAGELAVAAVPDQKRGERLIVLHTGLPCEAEELLAGALDGVPAVQRPRARDFHLVEGIPLLGTGKRDLGAIKQLAAEVTSEPASEPGAVEAPAAPG